MDAGGVDPGPTAPPHVLRPQLAIGIAPTPCKSPKQATPVISTNTPVFCCSSVTPGQMTPVTRVNAPQVPSLQSTEATAASHSSLSVNTQANLNEGNNSFKRMDCTPATAISTSSKAVSTSLSTSPGPQVASFSRPFHQPQVLTAQASALSCRPQHPPDHVTLSSAVPVPLQSEQQASVT